MFRKLVLLACLVLVAAIGNTALGADKNEYVGDNAAKCVMCHKDQVAAWKKWPMANAWDKLQQSKDKKDSCIPCHVTGFGKPGGFVSIKETPKLVNVQCEACHGPAGEHMKVPIKDTQKKKDSMTVPTEATCKACHKKEGNPNFKEFTYKDAVKKLADHLPKKK